MASHEDGGGREDHLEGGRGLSRFLHWALRKSDRTFTVGKGVTRGIMGQVPQRIVEKTWQEVAGFSPHKAKKGMMKIGNRQQELFAFVMESAKEMGQEVREPAIYMFVVVYWMFQEAHGKIKKISSEEIIECYEENESLMGRLEGAHEKFLDRIASVQTSRQPYVVKYVADALMENDVA